MAKKVLVIDDDPRMLELEKTLLVQGGFSVETASDSVEGLENSGWDAMTESYWMS
jgi:DNA-binding response OmpR family regulator